MIERKKIAGIAHKKLPCRGCGELIWVHHSVRMENACCVSCGYGKSFADIPGVGKTNESCTSERQYEGECKC